MWPERQKRMEELDYVFMQRDELISLLSKQYPSHFYESEPTEAGWTLCVCVHSPKGNLVYHIDQKNVRMFSHLGWEPNDWDGKGWEERSKRLEELRNE